MRSTSITLIVGAAVLLTQAFGKGEDAPSSAVAQFVDTSISNGSSATDVQPGVPAVTASDVDPCTFFSKVEIESAFGLPFGPPKKGRSGSSCMFYNPSTGTVSIRAGEAKTRAQFDSLPMMLGTNAERVAGIGQSAFFWGSHLCVLNNGHELVVSVSGEMTPKFRAALITLGKLGAPRLRS